MAQHAQLNWKPIPRSIRAQYNAQPGSVYAEMHSVQLAGDDYTFQVTVDVIAQHGDGLLVSFYRYGENPFEDFQLTYSMPAVNRAEAQQLAQTYLKQSVSLRYMLACGFTLESI